MTAQVRMLPSSAPTIEEMAKRIAADQPLPQATNAPFQHMEDIFLVSVLHDLDTTPDTYDISKKSPVYHAWNRGDWNYVGFHVVLARHPDAHDDLWGIQSDSGAEHFAQTMHDLCAEIMRRVDGGGVGDPPPDGVDVQLPTPERLASQSYQHARDAANYAASVLQSADSAWSIAKDVRNERTSKAALEKLATYLETAERHHADAQIAKQHAEIAYANGAPRPAIPYEVSGFALSVERAVGRIRWMVKDLSKESTPRISQKPPRRVEYVFQHAGLDPSSVEDAFAFLTAPWNDEYRRQLGISWISADYAAEWARRQPEVVYHGIHQKPPVVVDSIPLPSEDVSR